jgi:phosphoenolpyruvate carboxykinase (ATP)
VIDGILSGDILKEPTEILPGFNVKIPTKLAGVDSKLLNPRNTWANPQAYDEAAANLIAQFKANFTKYTGVSEKIVKEGGPQ